MKGNAGMMVALPTTGGSICGRRATLPSLLFPVKVIA